MLALLTSYFSRSSAGQVRGEEPDVIQFLIDNAKPKGCLGCFVYHTPYSKYCKKKKAIEAWVKNEFTCHEDNCF